MEILIIHGWFHSPQRYYPLKKELKKRIPFPCRIKLYKLWGFGGVKEKYRKNILDNYALELREYINSHKTDVIIAHSMGANIALRAVENMPDMPKLILLSPEYGGLKRLKFLMPLKPFVYMGLYMSKLPLKVSDIAIKLTELLTVNKWQLIDQGFVYDVKRASTHTAAVTMYEMISDNFRIKKTFPRTAFIIAGEKDRLIPLENLRMLAKDVGKCRIKVIKDIGHTAVVEALPQLTDIICKIIEIE